MPRQHILIYVPRIVEEADLSNAEFDAIVSEHFVSPLALRSANFDEFFEARFQSICDLISRAMGKEVIKNAADFDPAGFSDLDDDEEEDESTEETEE